MMRICGCDCLYRPCTNTDLVKLTRVCVCVQDLMWGHKTVPACLNPLQLVRHTLEALAEKLLPGFGPKNGAELLERAALLAGMEHARKSMESLFESVPPPLPPPPPTPLPPPRAFPLTRHPPFVFPGHSATHQQCSAQNDTAQVGACSDHTPSAVHRWVFRLPDEVEQAASCVRGVAPSADCATLFDAVAPLSLPLRVSQPAYSLHQPGGCACECRCGASPSTGNSSGAVGRPR